LDGSLHKETGTGIWSIDKKNGHMAISWAPSKTKEVWPLPLNPEDQNLKYYATYGNFDAKEKKS
jgi:hypothetical protein